MISHRAASFGSSTKRDTSEHSAFVFSVLSLSSPEHELAMENDAVEKEYRNHIIGIFAREKLTAWFEITQ